MLELQLRHQLDFPRRMAIKNQPVPFRFVLPVAQLLICLMLLWPVREFLFVGAAQSVQAYSSSPPAFRIMPDPRISTIVVPPTTIEQRAKADALIRLLEKRKLTPLVLDFPVLLAQLPYIISSPSRREWVPKGMFTDIWRAISWPFAGIFFWWLLGRGFEALFAGMRSVVRPRITWSETMFAGIMIVVGLLTLAGILTSTPDDRRDLQFMAWIAGGILWGILATVVVASRLMQRRIQREAITAQPTAGSNPI